MGTTQPVPTEPPMHPLGVHSHLFRGPSTHVAHTLREQALTCVQLSPGFLDLRFHEPGQLNAERCRLAAVPFRDAGIRVAALSAGSSWIDPDLSRRHPGIVRCQALIRHARDFGSDRIVLEAASAPDGHADGPTDARFRTRAELMFILHGLLVLA